MANPLSATVQQFRSTLPPEPTKIHPDAVNVFSSMQTHRNWLMELVVTILSGLKVQWAHNEVERNEHCKALASAVADYYTPTATNDKRDALSRMEENLTWLRSKCQENENIIPEIKGSLTEADVFRVLSPLVAHVKTLRLNEIKKQAGDKILKASDSLLNIITENEYKRLESHVAKQKDQISCFGNKLLDEASSYQTQNNMKWDALINNVTDVSKAIDAGYWGYKDNYVNMNELSQFIRENVLGECQQYLCDGAKNVQEQKNWAQTQLAKKITAAVASLQPVVNKAFTDIHDDTGFTKGLQEFVKQEISNYADTRQKTANRNQSAAQEQEIDALSERKTDEKTQYLVQLIKGLKDSVSPEFSSELHEDFSELYQRMEKNAPLYTLTAQKSEELHFKQHDVNESPWRSEKRKENESDQIQAQIDTVWKDYHEELESQQIHIEKVSKKYTSKDEDADHIKDKLRFVFDELREAHLLEKFLTEMDLSNADASEEEKREYRPFQQQQQDRIKDYIKSAEDTLTQVQDYILYLNRNKFKAPVAPSLSLVANAGVNNSGASAYKTPAPQWENKDNSDFDRESDDNSLISEDVLSVNGTQWESASSTNPLTPTDVLIDEVSVSSDTDEVAENGYDFISKVSPDPDEYEFLDASETPPLESAVYAFPDPENNDVIVVTEAPDREGENGGSERLSDDVSLISKDDLVTAERNDGGYALIGSSDEFNFDKEFAKAVIYSPSAEQTRRLYEIYKTDRKREFQEKAPEMVDSVDIGYPKQNVIDFCKMKGKNYSDNPKLGEMWKAVDEVLYANNFQVTEQANGLSHKLANTIIEQLVPDRYFALMEKEHKSAEMKKLINDINAAGLTEQWRALQHTLLQGKSIDQEVKVLAESLFEKMNNGETAKLRDRLQSKEKIFTDISNEIRQGNINLPELNDMEKIYNRFLKQAAQIKYNLSVASAEESRNCKEQLKKLTSGFNMLKKDVETSHCSLLNQLRFETKKDYSEDSGYVVIESDLEKIENIRKLGRMIESGCIYYGNMNSLPQENASIQEKEEELSTLSHSFISKSMNTFKVNAKAVSKDFARMAEEFHSYGVTIDNCQIKFDFGRVTPEMTDALPGFSQDYLSLKRQDAELYDAREQLELAENNLANIEQAMAKIPHVNHFYRPDDISYLQKLEINKRSEQNNISTLRAQVDDMERNLADTDKKLKEITDSLSGQLSDKLKKLLSEEKQKNTQAEIYIPVTKLFETGNTLLEGLIRDQGKAARQYAEYSNNFEAINNKELVRQRELRTNPAYIYSLAGGSTSWGAY